MSESNADDGFRATPDRFVTAPDGQRWLVHYRRKNLPPEAGIPYVEVPVLTSDAGVIIERRGGDREGAQHMIYNHRGITLEFTAQRYLGDIDSATDTYTATIYDLVRNLNPIDLTDAKRAIASCLMVWPILNKKDPAIRHVEFIPRGE